MSNEELGWLKAHLEIIIENQDKHDERLAKIEEQLSLYKTVIRTVRFIGLALIAIISFKLGDVKSLWAALVNG